MGHLPIICISVPTHLCAKGAPGGQRTPRTKLLAYFHDPITAGYKSSMAEDLPLYPDFLFPVYISIIDPDVINSSHVVRLSNNDVIRSMELSIEDGPIISPYSGNAFMAAYRAAAAYYTYYETRYSGEDLLDAITAALKRYIGNDDIIIYSFYVAILSFLLLLLLILPVFLVMKQVL